MDTATQLLATGYRHGPPTPGTGIKDADAVADLRCSKCGGRMRYDAWHNKHTGSYIAVAVCVECGNEEEF